MWLKNLPLKITALGLAVLLWFHVATNREYDYASSLALVPGSLPDAFALAQPLPRQVRVLLRGTGKDLLRLLFEDGRVEVILEPWLEGPINLSPDRLFLETAANVRVTQVLEPTQIPTYVDTVITRSARLKFQGEYATAAGVALVRPPTIDPFYVTLTGPRTLTADLASVATRAVDAGILDASADIAVGLDLDAYYNVKASPESVYIRFEVAPAVRRDVADIPIQAPSGWRTDPASVTLIVSGAAARLDSLSAGDYSATVTRAGVSDSDSLLPVEATVPSLVEILGLVPERVRLVKR